MHCRPYCHLPEAHECSWPHGFVVPSSQDLKFVMFGLTNLVVAVPRATVGSAMFLGLMVWSSTTATSEYCTKEQYESDRALIKGAISAGTIVRGPATLRDSILVQESVWFGMSYPAQIAFMQSFDCANAGPSGKHLLYVDVRSLSTGKLLATWLLGTLKPADDH